MRLWKTLALASTIAAFAAPAAQAAAPNETHWGSSDRAGGRIIVSHPVSQVRVLSHATGGLAQKVALVMSCRGLFNGTTVHKHKQWMTQSGTGSKATLIQFRVHPEVQFGASAPIQAWQWPSSCTIWVHSVSKGSLINLSVFVSAP